MWCWYDDVISCSQITKKEVLLWINWKGENYHTVCLVWNYWSYIAQLLKFDIWLHWCKDLAPPLLRASYERRERRKKTVGWSQECSIPIITDLLKPEEQKCYFQQSLKITQWLLSLPSWHSNYTCLRNAGTSGRAWSSHSLLSLLHCLFSLKPVWYADLVRWSVEGN